MSTTDRLQASCIHVICRQSITGETQEIGSGKVRLGQILFKKVGQPLGHVPLVF